LGLDLAEGILLGLLDALQAAAILTLQAFWVLQDILDGLPDHLIKLVCPDLLVLTDALPAEPEGIGTDAAVIGVISPLAPAGLDAYRLPVEGVATLLTLHQALQKVGGTAFSFSGLIPVLLELFLGRLEQFRTDNRRNWHRQPFFTGNIISGVGPPRLFGLSSPRIHALAHRPQAGLTEGGHAHVGRVSEHRPHAGPVPYALSFGAGSPLGRQSPTYLPDGKPVPPDPSKDLSHHLGLFRIHFDSRIAAALELGEVAESVGCTGQDVERSGFGRMQLPPAAAFHDFFALVFGHHALDLEQQVIFGRLSQRTVEENHLHAGPHEFLNEYSLVGIVPGKTVRGVDVEAVDCSGCGHITQAFEGGPHQRRPAIALIHESEFLR
jgi:hypothetical protein